MREMSKDVSHREEVSTTLGMHEHMTLGEANAMVRRQNAGRQYQNARHRLSKGAFLSASSDAKAFNWHSRKNPSPSARPRESRRKTYGALHGLQHGSFLTDQTATYI